MQSLSAARNLLERCDSVASSAPLLAQLGFDPPLIPLTFVHLERLGLPASLPGAHLATGRGALRAIVTETSADLRAVLEVTARTLGANPSLMWLIVAIERSETTTIAAVDSSRSRSRIAALSTRRSSVVDSDAETLCALAAAVTDSDVLTHCRWLEILGRDSVGRRFFRILESKVQQLASSLHPQPHEDDARALALLCASRLIFLSFLETKGWLDGDHGFLPNGYAECMVSGGRYHHRVLSPLFFGTLNTAPMDRASRARAFGRVPFLNGGLFARSPAEKRDSASAFTDEALGDFYGDLLTRFRFTAHEDSTTWSEAAIDPEMLGKAFEGLMSPADRKRSGAFYTPQSLVEEVTELALCNALACARLSRDRVHAVLRGERIRPSDRDALASAVDGLRVLDPACGSGAFLVHVLESMSRLRLRCGGPLPLHHIRRRMLTSSIFGVDANPTAVWLCELRLWLSMAIEDPERNPMKVTPLPNLDRNIRIGDSLSGDDFSSAARFAGAKVAKLRGRYARSTGPRKRTLGRALDALERNHALRSSARSLVTLVDQRREALAAVRSRDLFGARPHPDAQGMARLSALRDATGELRLTMRRLESGAALPFSFASAFADVACDGGFDIVVGNPPWIRTHNLDSGIKARLKRSYQVYASAAWRGGSEAAAAGRGFSSQVDSSALFIERSVRLLRQEGIAALVVPAKLWRSLAGGGVREFLLSNTAVAEVQDLTSSSSLFDAAVYPSVIVAKHTRASQACDVNVVAHRGGQARRWVSRSTQIPFDASSGSPWILAPAEVRRAFDLLSRAGSPLSRSHLGRPLLGVKTGCNQAFLISADEGATHGIEAGFMRPVVRGEDLTRWRMNPGESRIIWTHGATGSPVAVLPPAVARWLRPWRRELESRTDARDQRVWWRLFRVESASCATPRVIWGDIGRSPRATVLLRGDPAVPLNSCYAVACARDDDAHALSALINSELIAAWLSLLAEPARGGYRRYLGWTMALLPIPRDWDRAAKILSPIGRAAFEGSPPDDESLGAAVTRAFQIDPHAVDPLLEWMDQRT